MNLTYQVQKDHRYNNLNEEPHFEQFEIFFSDTRKNKGECLSLM